MFAFFEMSSAAITQFFLNCLAVGGGFLAGMLIGKLSAKAFDKWIIGKPTPDGLHKVAMYLCGIIVAIIVALVVFGDGTGKGTGSSKGTGEGEGEGKSANTNKGDGAAPTTPTTKEMPPIELVPKDPALPTELLKVILLGGEDVVEERFYKLSDINKALNFEEIKTEILQRKNASTKKMGLEIRLDPKNMLPREHVAVRRLEKWARTEAAMSVLFPGA